MISLIPLDILLPELAAAEGLECHGVIDDSRGVRTLAIKESYCIDRGCGCRRVLLAVFEQGSDEGLAMIRYNLDRAAADAGPDLHPTKPQGAQAGAVLKVLKIVLSTDKDSSAQLERHDALVKAAVADPAHAIHERIPAGLSAVGQPYVRANPKLGRNDPCACGSGQKAKKCCLKG